MQEDLSWAEGPFWFGFMKSAAIKIPKGVLPKLPKPPGIPTVRPGVPEGMKTMAQNAEQAAKAVPKIPPSDVPINYAKMNQIKQAPASTLQYGPKGDVKYTPPPKA